MAQKIRNILTVDPSVSATGWAFWEKLSSEDTKPTAYGVLRAKDIEQMVCGFNDLVTRRIPELSNAVFEGIEPRNEASLRSGSLFKLAWITGIMSRECWGITGELPGVVLPSTWKGQLPKKVVQDRLEGLIGIKFPDHAADAVGIGVYLILGEI